MFADDRGYVDHIMGGSPHHPLYYVVPCHNNNDASNSTIINNDERKHCPKYHVWVKFTMYMLSQNV